MIFASKSKKLCAYCNHKSKQEKKAQQKNKPESHAQRDMMLSIFDQAVKDGTWVSQISGAPLPRPPSEHEQAHLNEALLNWKWTMFFKCFSHLLPKGKYVEIRAEREAIWLVTPEEHDMWDADLRKALNMGGQIGEGWARKFEARQELLKRIAGGEFSKFNYTRQKHH